MAISPPIHRSSGYVPRETWRSSGRDSGKTTSERGYGWHWQKLRKEIIQRDSGLCQPCLKAGRITSFRDIDHIVGKAQGGTDVGDNLQCICRACHKIKTQNDNKGEGGKKPYIFESS